MTRFPECVCATRLTIPAMTAWHSPVTGCMLGGMSDTASNRITFERQTASTGSRVSVTPDGIRLKLTYHASGYLKAIHRTITAYRRWRPTNRMRGGAADCGCAAGLPPVL